MRRRKISFRAAVAAFAVLLGVIAATPSPVTAQEADAEEPERWAAQIDFGFNGSTGNTRLVVLSTGFSIKHLITSEFKLEWTALYRYGESEGAVAARNMRSVVSGDFWPESTVSPFFFGTVERDRFRRLAFRADGGGGAKLTFVDRRSAEASLSGALLYSHERFTPQQDGTLQAARTDARWSMRARVRRSITDGLRAEHTTFFQPVWDHIRDYNVDAVTRVTARINDTFGIGFTHTYKIDSTPPPDVLRNDQTLQVNLTIQF